jgi:hypothetical protein
MLQGRIVIAVMPSDIPEDSLAVSPTEEFQPTHLQHNAKGVLNHYVVS